MAALRSNQDTTGERCAEPALRHRVATAALTPRARRCIAPVLPPCTVSAVQFSSLTFSTLGVVRLATRKGKRNEGGRVNRPEEKSLIRRAAEGSA